MAQVEVRLPQWGMGMTEGTVLAWLKQVGDTVAEGEEIAEIDTAKATGMLESPAAGTIVEIVAQVDDEVPVGDVLCILETGWNPPRSRRRASCARSGCVACARRSPRR
jgi:pyruvate/2-oxoglutarate dehydrogenase complex dihydrolipoamide acyltransferase (E2) component